MTTEAITWQRLPALPDAETNVLLAMGDGTLEGFLDGTDDSGAPVWRDVTAVEVEGDVIAWAVMPRGPAC